MQVRALHGMPVPAKRPLGLAAAATSKDKATALREIFGAVRALKGRYEKSEQNRATTQKRLDALTLASKAKDVAHAASNQRRLFEGVKLRTEIGQVRHDAAAAKRAQV